MLRRLESPLGENNSCSSFTINNTGAHDPVMKGAASLAVMILALFYMNIQVSATEW